MNDPAVEARVEYDATYLRLLPDGEWFRCGDLDSLLAAPDALKPKLSRGWNATEAVSGDPVRAAVKVILPADVTALLERVAVQLRTTSTVHVIRVALKQLAGETLATSSPQSSCTHIH